MSLFASILELNEATVWTSSATIPQMIYRERLVQSSPGGTDEPKTLNYKKQSQQHEASITMRATISTR